MQAEQNGEDALECPKKITLNYGPWSPQVTQEFISLDAINILRLEIVSCVRFFCAFGEFISISMTSMH